MRDMRGKCLCFLAADCPPNIPIRMHREVDATGLDAEASQGIRTKAGIDGEVIFLAAGEVELDPLGRKRLRPLFDDTPFGGLIIQDRKSRVEGKGVELGGGVMS